MTHHLARTLFLAVFVGLGFGLLGGPIPGTGSPADSLWANPARTQPRRIVFLAGKMAEENLVAFTASVAASGHPGIVLLDTAKTSPHNKVFLASYKPERVVPVGSFPDGLTDLERRLEVKSDPIRPWKQGPSVELWKTLFPKAERVVVCPAKPRRLLLQAACLAGVLEAPLYVTHDDTAEVANLGRQLVSWKTRKVFAAGTAANLCQDLPGISKVILQDEDAVAAAYLRHQLVNGSVRNVVVTNPADVQLGLSGMSSLAPWIALQRRAALLLTNVEGDNVNTLVNRALQNRHLEHADALILVGDLKAIPMEKRPNPIAAGKDPEIEMEPLTPTGTEPFSLATGRLFNEDPAVVALVLARQRLLTEAKPSGKALVISNPGGNLPLLEAFSRNTTKELLNSGYQTTALFGKDVTKEKLRELLPEQDIFLWEGHYNTFAKEYHTHEWTEPLRPSLVFLQSCLALSEAKSQPFLERGAHTIVGSSTRTYSASGGACALAFFDALLYEDQSVGSSLRHAKNFLLTYSLLKEKRLGKKAHLQGANVRSAWAFSLWGDPTLKLPRPQRPEDALSHVRHQVHGNRIVVTLPDTSHDKAVTAKYQAQMLPNARLAGLLSKEMDDDGQRLVPFIFAEVKLPRGPDGATPRMHTRLPAHRWVSCWDSRRGCMYLLVTPRGKDREELRFQVTWENGEAVEAN